MKKMLPFIAAVAMLGAVSCKKDYACDCTTTDSSIASFSVTTTYTINDTKGNAEALCSADESSIGTLTTNCALN